VALTVTGALLDGEVVGVRCVDGLIAAIGAGVATQPGDEAIDAGGAPLVPALVNLVHAASGAVVDTTVVAGRVLMRGGVVEGEAEIVARAAERADRLGIRVDG